MANEYKQFHWYHVKNLDLENIKWDSFEYGQMFCIIFEDYTKIQIYPYKVMKYMINHYDLTQYDKRCDGKKYLSVGIMDNGFTPKCTVGTVRGDIQKFYDLVDNILEYKENQIANRMNEVLSDYHSLDFDFNDYNEAMIFVSDLRDMEDEDDILEDALKVFKEFNIDVDYDWDYDAGDEYTQYCSLDFTLKRNI